MPIHLLQRKPLLRGFCLAAFAAFVLQTPQVKAADTELSRYRTAEKLAKAHLVKFDTTPQATAYEPGLLATRMPALSQQPD